MEADTIDFCCGCLSSGRKMKPINSFWSNDAFLEIFTEIPIQTDALSLWLCWECEARITNFIKYKSQLKTCWNTLQDYVKGYKKPQPKSVSKLTIISQESLDTNETEHSLTVDADVKINLNNEDKELEVKVEETYSDDDDRCLIDIRNDKVVRKKRGKKDKKVKLKKVHKQGKMYEEIVLSREEILEERTDMAAKEGYVNAIFKCEKCIIPFANEDDLKDHELTKHSLVSKHRCEYCLRCFPTAGALGGHARRHAARLRCAACRHRSAAAAAALSHYAAAHTRGELFELAAKAFGNYEEKLQENDADPRPKSSAQIPCEFCQKTFRWKTSLRKHVEAHRIAAGHARRPYCEPCRLPFSSSSNLRKHVNTSSKHQIQLKLRKLQEAPAGETGEAGVPDVASIASAVNSQREQFPCPQCDKRFQWKGNLWRHLQSHAARAQGSLSCAPCGRTFSSLATYKQHMSASRRHVSEDDFKYMCTECGKKFSNKIKLRDHIDWEHLKNYTHTCAECQKVFKSHTSLYLHRQVVHRLYNAEHLCDHCGKSFPNKTKLRSHITALHSRESPYKCGACAARFSWHSCLSRHVRRVHRPAKPTPQ